MTVTMFSKEQTRKITKGQCYSSFKKRYLILIMLLLLMLTACNSTKYTSTSNYKDVKWDIGNNAGDKWKDAQNQFIADGVMGESENGYYYMNTLPSYTLLHYFDKKTGKSLVVCDQPNCKHNSKNCPGYLGSDAHGLSCYNGYIYYVDTDENKATHLFQMDSDGHNKKDMLILCNFNEGSYVRLLHFHRDNLYYYIGGSDGLGKLYRIDMVKNERSIVYEKINGKKTANLAHMKFVENTMYYEIIDRNSDGTNIASIFSYDMQTQQSSVVLEGEAMNSYTVTQDFIYYSTNINVQKYNIKTGETTILFDNVKWSQLSNDGKYLYVDISMNVNGEKIPREIVVLDWEDNIIDRINMGEEFFNYPCIFGGLDYLFLPKNTASGKEMYYFDKTKLGTGEHNWVKSQVVK